MDVKRFIPCALALALAGCAAQISASEAGPPPADYRAAVKQQVITDFFDPHSLQDVAITEPTPGRLAFQKGWIVCMRANGKNRFGAYAGQQWYSYLFQGNTIVDQASAFALACEGKPLRPWPEMEHMQ